VSGWRQLRAVLLLPAMVTVVVPALILWLGSATDVDLLPVLLGAVVIAFGLALVVWTVKLFVTVGQGTLAPWDPTSKLVVRGPYSHVRNPMITGVACILAGEALLFWSWPLLVVLVLFTVANAIYMPLAEEPGLRRRFGEEYDAYSAQVPRWVPRLRSWNATGVEGGSQVLPRRRPPGER
jgi:protein-S-isoprenylcysteine O-methyltransferase Ste14